MFVLYGHLKLQRNAQDFVVNSPGSLSNFAVSDGDDLKLTIDMFFKMLSFFFQNFQETLP